MRCPCRKKSEQLSYDACCGRYHAGGALPATAEALMRSRYAAFALGKTAYLLATWHPTSRPTNLTLAPDEEWLSLRILAARTEPDGNSATVEFIARSRVGGTSRALHEISRFTREGGRWLYTSGAGSR